MIKKIVRSLLWRTGIGRKAGAAFWQKVDHGEGIKMVYQSSKRVFDGLSFQFDDSRLNAFLKQESEKWSKQTEYIVEIKDALVEPERCLAIQGFNKLVVQSVVYQHDYQYPYISSYLIGRFKARQLDHAVLYDGSASRNYYHHFVNAVNSLYMLQKAGLPDDIPFIINRVSFESRFFQYLYTRSIKFRNLNWLVQETGEWYKVKSLYRMQCLHFDAVPWQYTRQVLYEIEDKKPHRKVFLSRDSRLYSRSLTNEDEIASILSKHGFEKIYAEHLSMEEQTVLFQETSHLVALTGMGLIQQFYMNYKAAHVLEIMPSSRLMPEYYWQAHTLGIGYYDILVGEDMDKSGRYRLDPAVLGKALDKMLNNSQSGA